jgi:hypothetical protein
MQIAYLDGPRLRRSLLAACDHAQRQRGELNRINVFPVPDGDTGTNLALTVRAISDHLRGNEDREVASVARAAAQAAVLGARGNCGMMLSHFFLGFASSVQERVRLTSAEFADALRAGVDTLHAALDRPIEGTILTVMRDTAHAAAGADTPDFVPLVQHLVTRARDSLARTPELLPVLKSAGVVDAGAKGFVALLEGVLLLISGDPLLALEPSPAGAGEGAAGVAFPGSPERYRFCTEALVRGHALPDQAVVKERLKPMGDSLIVIRSGELLKVHIHTDDPEGVFSYLRRQGNLATHKAEDMRAQHDAVERASGGGHVTLARRPVTVMTDSAADLPEEVVRAHGIHVTPLLLVTDERTFRDGIDITAPEFQRRLIEEPETLPTTSQPSPADFLETFARAAEDGEEVLGVILGSSLSGTYSSAAAAARTFAGAPLHLMDSMGASLLQGLLVLRAAELAELGMAPAEIVRELERVRARSGILFTVDTFDRLLASGRVGRGRALLGSLLQVKPVLGLDASGRIEVVGKAIGRRRVRELLLDEVAGRLPRGAEGVRFGIVHVGCPEIVAPIREELRRRFGDRETLIAPATPVISTHLGPGAWGVAYLVES